MTTRTIHLRCAAGVAGICLLLIGLGACASGRRAAFVPPVGDTEGRLGLLEPVRGPDGGAPTPVEMLARYNQICERFLGQPPETPPQERVQPLQVVTVVTFDGPLLMACEKETGAVRTVTDRERWAAIQKAEGETAPRREAEGSERRKLLAQFTDLLREKLDLAMLEEPGTVAVTQGLFHGRDLYGLRWLARYHDYPHLDDGLDVTFEKTEEGLRLCAVRNFGAKLEPPEPAMTGVSAVQAMDIAAETVQKRLRPGMAGLKLVRGPAIIGRAFVYRNDLFNSRRLFDGGWAVVAERRETHLCYLVEFAWSARAKDGAEQVFPLMVYVDCANGAVVGGRY